jgi:hypothetical protein
VKHWACMAVFGVRLHLRTPPLCERSIVTPLLLFDSPATSQLGGP